MAKRSEKVDECLDDSSWREKRQRARPEIVIVKSNIRECVAIERHIWDRRVLEFF